MGQSGTVSMKSTFTLPDMERLWPAKGNRLLRVAGDWEKAVSFSHHRIARHVYIWDGYVRAGATLIDQCERSATDRHDLVYPILFCYRHGLELAMKWIIAMYGRHAGVHSVDYLNHDLWKLWQACKKVILDFGSDGDNEALRAVEQIVKDFHDLDRSSMTFRYYDDKTGNTIRLPDKPIDLENIKTVMTAVQNFFGGVDGQLGEYSKNAPKKGVI